MGSFGSNCEVFQGAVLRQQDFPAYFQGLADHRCVAVDDAQGSPLSNELLKPYLQPLGITSLIDAPLFIAGRLVGVVCHEHVGPVRHWSESEADFACAVADNIARLSDMLRVLPGSTIVFNITAAAHVSRVFIDGSQLERMALNLALNARDAMPQGGQLSISIEDARMANEDGESATFV